MTGVQTCALPIYDMIDFAKAHMTDIANKKTEIEKNEDEDENTSSKTSFVEVKAPVKTFKPDDEIPCKSVTPWKLSAVGVDKNTIKRLNKVK